MNGKDFFAVAVLVLVYAADAFVPFSSRLLRHLPRNLTVYFVDKVDGRGSRLMLKNEGEEEKSVTVDWDQELKRLNRREVKGISEVEVTVEKFKKQVDRKLNETLPIRIPVPSVKSAKKFGNELLTKDWRFWVSVVAVFAFLSALSVGLQREELVVLNEQVPDPWNGYVEWNSESPKALIS